MNKRMLTSRKLCHILAVLVMMLLPTTAQYAVAQVKGEYFWGADPGVGKATCMESAGVDGDYTTFDISADKIPVGMNILGLRAFEGGRWSQTLTYLVMVPANPTTADWRVEYFWDNDPGTGKATPLEANLGQDGGIVVADVPAEGLAPGEHLLGFRTCSGHAWSQTVTSTVVVSNPRQYAVVGAEYFWGADPGFGKGTPIEVVPGEDVTIEGLEIEFPAEKADEYVLSFRACTEKGWGLTQTTVLPHLYVTQIVLSSERTWLEPGETMALTAEVTPADAFDAELVWSSTDPSVAIVAADGTVTGVATGEASIVATSTDGSEVSDTLALRVLVPVKQITLSQQELTVEMTREAELTATVDPAGATNPEVVWSVVDDGDCVAVSETGIVSGLHVGQAKVVASAADGLGAADTCIVTVTYLRGDANGNGSLAVNDVVLTARGVVGDMDSNLKMEAVDMNADNVLTVGDLTQVVDAVITYAEPANASGMFRSASYDYMAAPLLLKQAGSDVLVTFDNDSRFAGLQFDVLSLDGLAVTSVTLSHIGEGHSAANYRFGNDNLRMMAYGTCEFPANEPVAAIHTLCERTSATSQRIVLTNVMASDCAGNLYRLPDTEINVSPLSGLDTPSDEGVAVAVDGHILIITSTADTAVLISDIRGICRQLDIKAGVNRFTVPDDGIYIVNAQKIVIR